MESAYDRMKDKVESNKESIDIQIKMQKRREKKQKIKREVEGHERDHLTGEERDVYVCNHCGTYTGISFDDMVEGGKWITVKCPHCDGIVKVLKNPQWEGE